VEEFEKLDVQMNQEKTRIVDLSRNETFSFLGFDYRRVKTRRGVWGVRVTPRLKARTALLRELKEVFRRHQSQPVDRVIYLINPILRGWVNYFRVGHSSECFGYVKDWVLKKIRRHLMHVRKRRGFGWNRWNRAWFYDTLGLFNDYGVRYYKALKRCQLDRSHNPLGEVTISSHHHILLLCLNKILCPINFPFFLFFAIL
jgi:RNA-directed DNA polymerase